MSKKLGKAIAALHAEIAKLEPKQATRIRKHIASIRVELQKAVAPIRMMQQGQGDPWIGDELEPSEQSAAGRSRK